MDALGATAAGAASGGVARSRKRSNSTGRGARPAVLLGGDLDDSLEQPQLQRCRVLGHRLGGLSQLLRSLQFTLGGDDA
ncbi:hypothetical protein [Nonomuraea recticatena]|uniref:hypothetical protein n=1 Tax=Nonomuraea recticatena TaxID=46178 RepID=UPI003613070C